MIGHPRKKLKAAEAASRYIVTGPWFAYRFNPGDVEHAVRSQCSSPVVDVAGGDSVETAG